MESNVFLKITILESSLFFSQCFPLSKLILVMIFTFSFLKTEFIFLISSFLLRFQSQHIDWHLQLQPCVHISSNLYFVDSLSWTLSNPNMGEVRSENTRNSFSKHTVCLRLNHILLQFMSRISTQLVAMDQFPFWSTLTLCLLCKKCRREKEQRKIVFLSFGIGEKQWRRNKLQWVLLKFSSSHFCKKRGEKTQIFAYSHITLVFQFLQ